MAVAETAKLAVELSLDDTKFARSISRIDRRLGAFSGAVNRNLGRALDFGITKGVRVLTDAFTGGIESLRKLESVQAQTQAVLTSTGNRAGVTAKEVRDLAEEFENLNATIDDKVIQSGENLLLTFAGINKKAFKPTLQAALDMNEALGKGEGGLSSTITLLGKALSDPEKGLTKLERATGKFSDAERKAIADALKHNNTLKAQQIILTALEKYGGSFKKAGETAAGAQAKLNDAIEELQMAFAGPLLPVVTKITTRLTEFFGKKEVAANAERIGNAIAGLFTDENLTAAGNAIETAAKAVGVALNAFNSLPKEVKALAIGAFALNKVSGGAIGGAAAAFGKIVGAGFNKIFAAQVTVIGKSISGPGSNTPSPGGFDWKNLIQGGVATLLGIGATQAIKELGDSLVQPIADATGLAADAIAQVDDRSRAQSFGFLESLRKLVFDFDGTLADTGDAVDQLSRFINDPHPDFLGDLGKLLNAQYNTKPTAAQPKGMSPSERLSNTGFRAGERDSEATTVTGIPKVLVAQEAQTRATVVSLREKLAAVIKGEAAAQRAGDQARAARLNAKEDAIRARLQTANAQLSAIRAKKTSFKLNTFVNVNTSVAVSEVKRQARYTSRVARATALSAS